MLAGLAVAEARALDQGVRCIGSRVAMPPGPLPDFRSQPVTQMADEPSTSGSSPMSDPSDTEAAMNAYLSWEVDLLERIKQDGTTHFLHAR